MDRPHGDSPDKVRWGSFVVPVNFTPFYETFEIKECDGMYLAPEQRVSIW